MKVTFKTVKQESFVLDIEETTKIADVKALVEAEKGDAYPVASQLIISQGKILKDDTTLADNKISTTGFLVVMVQAKAKPKAADTPAATSAAPQTSTPSATAPAAATAPPAEQASAPGGTTEAGTAAAPERATPTPAPAETAGSGDPYSSTASQLSTGSALEQNISQICEMGFPREEVQRAMRAAYNNPDRAVEYLMSGIPASAQAAAAPPSPAPAAAGSPSPAATGPNAQPLDMFAPQPAPGAGGGGSGGQAAASGPLDFLRSNPQFQGLRNIVRANPQILQPMLQELSKQNPQLLSMINQHQAEFLRLLNEPASGGSPDAADLAAQLGAAAQGGGMPGEPVQVHLTPEEMEIIERLEALGFDRMLCVEAFLACDKNEALAANFLLENATGGDDMIP